MVWWPFIVLAVFLFIAFYPLAIRGNMSYIENEWLGIVTLHPVFGLKFIKITLWDTENPKVEKPKKEKKEKEKVKEEKKEKIEVEEKKHTSKFSADTILQALDILKPVNKGVLRLRIHLNFTYALEDPAAMGYVAGPIYSILPLILGDMGGSRWRVRVLPHWEAFANFARLKFKATICIFDIFYAFGGILVKVIKQIIESKRRK